MTYSSKSIDTKSDYLKGYVGKNDFVKEDKSQKGTKMENVGQTDLDTNKIENAMQVALDTRKFEIDLYWKRANYFWLYNASAFTAYFYVISHKEIEMCNVLTLLITGIGVFLSLCWMFVNKASKYWQENWEKHVDLLEDDYMGSLYKTTLKYTPKWHERINPISPFKYSVSKINQLMSFGILLIWVLLWIFTISKTFQGCFFTNIYADIVFVVTVVLLVLLPACCLTSKATKKEFNMRRLKIDDKEEGAEGTVK